MDWGGFSDSVPTAPETSILEPPAYSLQMNRSSSELPAHASYCLLSNEQLGLFIFFLFLFLNFRFVAQLHLFNFLRIELDKLEIKKKLITQKKEKNQSLHCYALVKKRTCLTYKKLIWLIQR